jgi:hypothetical protein
LPVSRCTVPSVLRDLPDFSGIAVGKFASEMYYNFLPRCMRPTGRTELIMCQ